MKGAWLYTWEFGGGKEKGRFSKESSYAKKDLQDLGGLAIVKVGFLLWQGLKTAGNFPDECHAYPTQE